MGPSMYEGSVIAGLTRQAAITGSREKKLQRRYRARATYLDVEEEEERVISDEGQAA